MEWISTCYHLSMEEGRLIKKRGATRDRLIQRHQLDLLGHHRFTLVLIHLHHKLTPIQIHHYPKDITIHDTDRVQH
jgi:hypothetical protein